MTTPAPQVGPEFHRTQNWMLVGLRALAGDLALPRHAGIGGGANSAVAAMVTELGFARTAPEADAAIARAVQELAPLAGFFIGPRAMEVRFLALTGGLRAATEAADFIPEKVMVEAGHPNIAGLSTVLYALNRAAGSGYRRRAAERLRGVYVIVDPDLTNGRDPRWVAEEAIRGGATALQLRDKRRDKGDVLPLAHDLAALCEANDVTFIVNDHADLALATGAHGVHVGQHDLPLAAAQAVLKPWQIAGTSNALVSEAEASRDAGADYIAVGRMFPTNSKDNTRPAGLETLRRVRAAVPTGGPPLVAIGGITPANVAEVAVAGADGICVLSAVTQAEDPRRSAARLLTEFRRNHRA